jgi:cellulase/cellobiase CelA1
LLDPIGFGFESFDGIGRHRDDDNGKPLDLSGQIFNTPRTDGTFNGPAELGARLAASADVHECFALQWFRFAYGVREADASSCTVSKLSQSFTEQGLDLDALVVALTQAPHFTRRAPDIEPTGTPVASDAGASTSDAGVPASDGGTSTDAGPPPPPPPPPSDLMVTETIRDPSAQGWCSDVIVKNVGDTNVTWVVTLTIAGTLQTVWNAVAESAGTETRFSGVFWNAQLAPGAETTFGYCAGR